MPQPATARLAAPHASSLTTTPRGTTSPPEGRTASLHGSRHGSPYAEGMTPPLGTSTAPVLGLAEAAKACGVSESTLRRRRPDLLAAGATQTSKGWRIPIPALVELGLMPRVTAPDSPQQPRQEAVTAPATQSPTEPLLEALRAKLADAEKRAAVAEAIAQERERIIEAQALALRMLTPGPTTPQEQPAPAPEQPAEQPREQPGRWWRRLF